MNKKGPSNVFVVPSWMKNLQVLPPSGSMTPDQLAESIELCLLLNGGDLTILKDCITGLICKVPLKNQPFVRHLLVGDVMANVQNLIRKSNEKLALITKEAPIEPRTEEVPDLASGQSDSHSPVVEWGSDWDSPSGPKPRSRGLRALRSAKRGQAEA